MGKSHHVAAMFIYSFTGIHSFWLLETSWTSKGSPELRWFCLLPDSGVWDGKWWLVAGLASAVSASWSKLCSWSGMWHQLVPWAGKQL